MANTRILQGLVQSYSFFLALPESEMDAHLGSSQGAPSVPTTTQLCARVSGIVAILATTPTGTTPRIRGTTGTTTVLWHPP